eukprot:286879_1
MCFKSTASAYFWCNYTLWFSMFTIQFYLSTAIAILLYNSVYFWISAAFWVFLYLISLCYVCAGYIFQTARVGYKLDPFTPLLFPYLLVSGVDLKDKRCSAFNTCQIHIDFECKRSIKSVFVCVFYIFCYVITMIPFIIWMLFLPFIILHFWYCDFKDNLIKNHMYGYSAMFALFIIPHNIIHLVFLMNEDINDNIILYLLLLICIFLSLLWYISFIYMALHYQDPPINYQDTNYKKNIAALPHRLIWTSFVMDFIILFFAMIMYLYIGTKYSNI